MSKQIHIDATPIPVVGRDGVVILYDIYVDGRWIGSARTIKQCEERVRWHMQEAP